MLMILQNIIIALGNAYTMVIFVYVLMSWLPDTETGVVGQVYRALGTLCDPYLDLFRRLRRFFFPLFLYLFRRFNSFRLRRFLGGGILNGHFHIRAFRLLRERTDPPDASQHHDCRQQ